MSTIRVVNLQHTDATEPNIVLESDGTAVFASGITISGGTNLTISGVAEFASGTVSAPTITFIDDNNTGIYEPAADTVAITTSGTERLRVDNSGNVGIATSSPSLALHVAGPQPYASGPTSLSEVVTKSAARIQGSSNATTSLFFGAETSNANPYIQVTNGNGSTSDPLVLQPFGGDVGIGTSSPGSYDSSASNLVVGSASGDEGITIAAGTSSSSTINFADGTSGSAAYTGRILYQHSADALTLHTNGGLERVRIDSAGKVGIGTSSPSDQLGIHEASSNSNNLKFTGTDVSSGLFVGYDGSAIAQFWHTANKAMRFGTNNTERMRIDSSGFIHQKFTSNNSSTPEGLFINNQNNATGNNASLIFSNDSGNRKKVAIAAVDVGNYGASDLVFALDSADSGSVSLSTDEKMRIDSSGRVMIGTTTEGYSPHADTLTLADSGHCGLTIRSGTSSQGNIYFSDGTSGGSEEYEGVIQYIHSDNSMRFGVNNGVERMRMFSSGAISVNTTSEWFSRYFIVESTSASGGSAAFLASDTSVYPVSVANYASSGDNNFIGFWTDSRSSPTQRGDIDYNRSAGQVRYNVTSDRRLKSNIKPAESAINLLSSIQVRSYTWTESQYKVKYGFVAQELHDHVPDAVKQGDDGDEIVNAWSIDNSKLVPVLTKALQEAIAKIETLEAAISDSASE